MSPRLRVGGPALEIASTIAGRCLTGSRRQRRYRPLSKKGKRPSKAQGGCLLSSLKDILAGQDGTKVTMRKVSARQFTEGPWPNAGPKLNDSGT